MAQNKRTIVTCDVQAAVVTVRKEPAMKLSFQGISKTNYEGNADYGSHCNTQDVYIPLWAINSIMQQQREAFQAYYEGQVENLAELRKAFYPPSKPLL
jgi:hypothetical protein